MQNFPLWKNDDVKRIFYVLMALCKSAVSPLLMQWRYCSLALCHLWSANSAAAHYSDVIMSAMVSQITSLTIVYSTVYSGGDQRKRQSSASLAFVREIHRSPVNSSQKGPVTRKMFPFDLMTSSCDVSTLWSTPADCQSGVKSDYNDYLC